MVLCPTRELAHQIHLLVKRLLKPQGAVVCGLYGGVSVWEQKKALRALCESVVGTPGRILDHVKSGSLRTTRITFVVLDEGDSMLDLGFEHPISSIFEKVSSRLALWVAR